jgi:hypothetical protein
VPESLDAQGWQREHLKKHPKHEVEIIEKPEAAKPTRKGRAKKVPKAEAQKPAAAWFKPRSFPPPEEVPRAFFRLTAPGNARFWRSASRSKRSFMRLWLCSTNKK